MSEKVKAIVIKKNDRKEKDASVLLFSVERGKFWAVLRGVKSAGAKLKAAQNPFCFGEFLLEEGKSGPIVVGLETIETFYEITADVDKFFEGSAVLECLAAMEFSTTAERAKIFVLALKTLKSICFGSAARLYSLCKFFLELFAATGTPLYSATCTCCRSPAFDKIYLDFTTGQLVCAACKGFVVEEVPKAAYIAMKILSTTDFDKLSSIKLAAGSEIALLKILVRNFNTRYDENLKLIGILQ